MANKIDGNLNVVGMLSCDNFSPPDACIDDDAMSSANPTAASKLKHRHIKGMSQAHGSAGTAERRIIHVAEAAGVINWFRAVVSVAPTSTGVHTIKLKKNGSDILSADLLIDVGNTAFTFEAASGFTSAAYVAGDTFEVAVTVAGTTLGQGLYAYGEFDESPS